MIALAAVFAVLGWLTGRRVAHMQDPADRNPGLRVPSPRRIGDASLRAGAEPRNELRRRNELKRSTKPQRDSQRTPRKTALRFSDSRRRIEIKSSRPGDDGPQPGDNWPQPGDNWPQPSWN